MERPAFVAVGRVVGTHGVNGALRVALLSDFPAALKRRKRLLIGDAHESREVARLSIVGEDAIFELVGISTREAADALRGEWLYIPAAEVTRPPRGHYFIHDIVGLRVIATGDRELGVVTEVLRTGANDVYVVAGDGGELLIPAIEPVVKRIDIRGGRILIKPLPGLLPDGL